MSGTALYICAVAFVIGQVTGWIVRGWLEDAKAARPVVQTECRPDIRLVK